MRRRFLTGALGTLAAALGGAASGASRGPRTGPWCLDLSKSARENAFDFSLYLLDGEGAVFTLGKLGGMVSCISVGDLTPEQMDNEAAVALSRKRLRD